MEWDFFLKVVAPLVASVLTVLTGLVVILYLRKINKVRLEQAEIEKKTAEKKLELKKSEFSNQQAILVQEDKIINVVSDRISKQLINNPRWLDRFMDQTGVTYRASVYGKRIAHFFYEKKIIAQHAVQAVEGYLKDKNNDDIQYCILIDSGTTLYPIFQELTMRIHMDKELWKGRVCIVTNNIPGVQYFMKHGKEDPNNDYSEILIDCFVVPGKPLSVYAAITGKESDKWVLSLRENVLNQWTAPGKQVKIISFVTGNYFIRHTDDRNRARYFPVARGEGHVEFKKVIVSISDEVFLLSPLTKFSFANVDLLNQVNSFAIGRADPRAVPAPREVKYEEIFIPEDKPCRFFTTKRNEGALFHDFGNNLYESLCLSYDSQKVSMPTFDLKSWIPNIEKNSHLEIEREIPHDKLRDAYLNKKNIWDLNWVANNQG